MIRLDERDWIYGRGLGEGWRAVSDARRKATAGRLRAAAAGFAKRAPRLSERAALAAGSAALAREAAGDAALLDAPALDYWLYLWETQFGEASPAEAWDLQFRLIQPLAALRRARLGRAGSFPAAVDADGHLHFYGTSAYLELPAGWAGRPITVESSRRGLRARADGKASAWLPLDRLSGRSAADESAGVGRLKRPPSPGDGIGVQFCGPLMVHGVIMHGLAKPSPAEAQKFSDSLSTALAHLAERDAGLSAEMREMVSVLIPLVNPQDHGSVSSSYVNLRGAICLSHSDDALLQAETLIHEFCHQKMNQLLAVEALLEPGQGGQVFYSPWRGDARRLRGLLLGAHAFLNVARYLIVSLSRERYPLQRRVSIMTNAARRLFEVRDAMQTISGYAQLTEFGRRFALGMNRELTELFHAAQWFPSKIVDDARDRAAAHRRKHALPDLGFHKAEGFARRVKLFETGDPKKGAA